MFCENEVATMKVSWSFTRYSQLEEHKMPQPENSEHFVIKLKDFAFTHQACVTKHKRCILRQAGETKCDDFSIRRTKEIVTYDTQQAFYLEFKGFYVNRECGNNSGRLCPIKRIKCTRDSAEQKKATKYSSLLWKVRGAFKF